MCGSGRNKKASKQTTKNPREQKTTKAKRAQITVAGDRSAERSKDTPHRGTRQLPTPAPPHVTGRSWPPFCAGVPRHRPPARPPASPAGSGARRAAGSAHAGVGGGRSGGAAGPPGRRRHHVPLQQRPLWPLVLLLLPPAEGGRLVGVPRLPLQHIGAGARPRPASPADARRRLRRRLAAALRFAPSAAAASPPPLPVGPPRALPPVPVAAPQPEVAIAAGRSGAWRAPGPPGQRARRRRQQPGKYCRAPRGLGAGPAPSPGGCQSPRLGAARFLQYYTGPGLSLCGGTAAISPLFLRDSNGGEKKIIDFYFE